MFLCYQVTADKAIIISRLLQGGHYNYELHTYIKEYNLSDREKYS